MRTGCDEAFRIFDIQLDQPAIAVRAYSPVEIRLKFSSIIRGLLPNANEDPRPVAVWQALPEARVPAILRG